MMIGLSTELDLYSVLVDQSRIGGTNGSKVVPQWPVYQASVLGIDEFQGCL
jgi:hypothetical protein